MENNKKLLEWGFPVAVWFVGAVLGIAHKGGKKSVRTVILSVTTSMFVAFITYGAAYYFTDIEIVRVAVSGLTSYMSTNTIVVFEEIIILAICKKLGIKRPDKKECDEDENDGEKNDNQD
jgi:hypothetical protein